MKLPLTLEALEVVDAIESRGSFAAAAAVLNKVPSAISYTVQKLEQDLGVTLFQKEGRRAVLTDAGHHLVEQGRLLLAAADALAIGTRQVATGWEPRLRIAVDTLIPLETVMPVVTGLLEQQPGIEISLTTEVLAGTWEALVEGRVDLIIGGVGDAPGHKGIRCEPWRKIDHVFVASPEHPLCQAAQPVNPEVIQQYRAIVVSDTSRNSTPLSRGLLDQQSTLHVPTMEAKLAAHRLGLGVGYVPLPQVAGDLESGALVAITLSEHREDNPAMLGWRAGNRGRALRYLLDLLRQPADN